MTICYLYLVAWVELMNWNYNAVTLINLYTYLSFYQRCFFLFKYHNLCFWNNLHFGPGQTNWLNLWCSISQLFFFLLLYLLSKNGICSTQIMVCFYVNIFTPQQVLHRISVGFTELNLGLLMPHRMQFNTSCAKLGDDTSYIFFCSTYFY